MAHPHPQSDTPGASRGRGGGAEPQTTKSGAASGCPSPGRLGVAAARRSRSPPLGPSQLLPSRPPGWEARGSAAAASASAGVTVTPASLGMPPTHRHTRRHGGEEKTRAARTEQIEDLALHPAPSRRATHPGKPHGRPDTRPDRGGAGSHPSPDAAGHADSDRSPLPAPPPAPTPRRSPTQTHKSHTQTHTHTDSRARLLTLGATRRPQAGRVCACVTRRHLPASLPFTGTPRFHPHQAAPPRPRPLRPSPSSPPPGFPPQPGQPIRLRSEEVLGRTPCLSSGPHF